MDKRATLTSNDVLAAPRHRASRPMHLLPLTGRARETRRVLSNEAPSLESEGPSSAPISSREPMGVHGDVVRREFDFHAFYTVIVATPTLRMPFPARQPASYHNSSSALPLPFPPKPRGLGTCTAHSSPLDRSSRRSFFKLSLARHLSYSSCQSFCRLRGRSHARPRSRRKRVLIDPPRILRRPTADEAFFVTNGIRKGKSGSPGCSQGSLGFKTVEGFRKNQQRPGRYR